MLFSYDDLRHLSLPAERRLFEERKENRQKALNSLLHRSAIPRRYEEAQMVEISPEQVNAYTAGRRFVENFESRLRTGAGMVLWGDVGTGKTHLVCAMANALIVQMRSVVYCTAMEAILAVRATFGKGGDASEFDVYERFAAPELLILDEIGVQRGTEDERMVLTSIADIRSRNCLPTIIVSNLDPERIYDLLGERLFDRLVGFGADIVNLPGRSLRIRAVGGA